MSKEYFGNLPMLNDGTYSETQSFLITETQLAIQTEVALQKDYVLSACEGEKSQCIAEIVILSPAQRTPVVKSSTIILVVLIFCPQCGATRRNESLI